jgi:hypothetical protein
MTQTDFLTSFSDRLKMVYTSDAFQGFSIPFLPVLFLNMLAILILAFLGLLHQQCQPVQGQSVELPLVVRSPYVNCWLVQTNTTLDDCEDIMTSTHSSNVCPFAESNSNLYLRSLCLC